MIRPDNTLKPIESLRIWNLQVSEIARIDLI